MRESLAHLFTKVLVPDILFTSCLGFERPGQRQDASTQTTVRFSTLHLLLVTCADLLALPPPPSALPVQAKVQHVVLPDSARKDASLEAANWYVSRSDLAVQDETDQLCPRFILSSFRNVLVGWKWDRETDLPRLRELIWNEIRRLLKRKADGGLAFDPTTDPSRVDDV